MMSMSKDHQSAGLRWSLPLVDAGLGGHGRPLGLFCSYFIFSINLGFLAGCHRRPFFVKEYAVDQWTKWRTSHFLHHFLLSLVPPQTIFSWRYFPYLLVNEESQPFIIIMKLWEVDFCLGNVPLQRLELRTKRGGKNVASRGNHFSLSFLNHFEPSDASLTDMSLWMEWAGFLFFGLWIWLMTESDFFFLFSFFF